MQEEGAAKPQRVIMNALLRTQALSFERAATTTTMTATTTTTNVTATATVASMRYNRLSGSMWLAVAAAHRLDALRNPR